MTATELRDAPPRTHEATWARTARHAGPVSALMATAWWLVAVTHSWGGWDAPSVTVGAVLTAVAVALVRPHRVLPAIIPALAAAISAAAFLVALTAPTGWAGAPSAAIYAGGAWLAVVIAAVCVARPELTLWFMGLVVISAPIEFVSGWLGWWGGDDPTLPMVGTFYWHNPFAAFLLPGGLLGLAFWIWRRRLFAAIGLLGVVFAAAGIAYSTSRAALADFAGGVVLFAVLALFDGRRRRALRRLFTAALIAAAATYVIGGPPFFASRGTPVAAEQARTAGQSLGQNGHYRLDFWREALTVFRHHPLNGGGFKSLVAESIGHVDRSWPLSPYAHNGYLQALSDGGLLLAVPFLLAVGWIVVMCVRSLVTCLRRRDAGLSGFAVPVALGCLLLHAVVDFDWSYPANFAMVGVLSGLVIAGYVANRHDPARVGRARHARWAAVACVLAGIGLLGVSAWVMRDGDHGANLPVVSASAR